MRLFLLLSAMLAGLTGLIAGGPAQAREPAAIASALCAGAEQASESAVTRSAQIPTTKLTDSRAVAESGQPILSPQTHPVDERRIE